MLKYLSSFVIFFKSGLDLYNLFVPFYYDKDYIYSILVETTWMYLLYKESYHEM